MKKNKHEGSDFRDFFEEEGILKELEPTAVKRALAIRHARLRGKRPRPR
jgi:hypothetical protein